MEIPWLNMVRAIGEIFSLLLNIYLLLSKNKEKNEKNFFIKEQRKKDKEIKSLKKEIEDLRQEKFNRLEEENYDLKQEIDELKRGNSKK